MLAQIRTFAKTPFAGALMALLVASFAVWGIRDVFNHTSIKDSVVSAGSRTISSRNFARYFQNFKKEQEQRNNGQPISQDELFGSNIDLRLADELATQSSLNELIRREGVRPSDKFILDEIRKAKIFFDPITGKFDEKAYKTYLAQNGMTADDLEGEIRDQLAEQHFTSGLGAGLSAPLIYSALAASYGLESRSLQYLVLTPAQVPPPAKPSDAELQAFMKDNAARLIKPETRTITLVRFSANLLGPTLKLDEADIQKRFNFEKDTLSKPETRSVVQLVLKSAAEATQAAAKLKAGEDPAAVAKAMGAPAPIILTDEPKSHIADASVADAAFSLPVGATSGAINGQLGFAVVKVLKATPGHAVTLDEVRAKVEDEVRKANASDKAFDLSKKYDEAHSGGANLVDAAKKVGAPVVQLPPVTKDGKTAAGQPLPVPPRLLQEAFAMNKGGETEGVEEAAPGEYYAIRIDDIAPQAPMTLEEVRGPITQRLMQQALIKSLNDKADAVIASIKKGASIEDAARSAGVTAQTVASLSRQDRAAIQTLGQEFVGQVFAAKAGDVIKAGTQVGVAVVKVDKSTPADTTEVARQSVQRQPMIANVLNQDVAAAIRLAARAIIKPTIDYRQARAAAGGDPKTVTLPGAGAQPDKAKQSAKPAP